MLLLLPLWVLGAFILSQLIVSYTLVAFDLIGLSLENFVTEAVARTVTALAVYALSIAIVIGVPYAFRQRVTSLRVLGIDRLPSWADIGLAPIAFIGYLLATSVVMAVVVTVFTDFPSDQVQDVGFNVFGTQMDKMLAFATLVVLAPFAEELLFRGYLYGKLKKHVPVVVAAIASSALFGAVHLQWNVAVDVFVLGLILCGLRSLTGSIWAGVLVHMIKNAIAYYLLFVSPLLGV